MVPLTIYRCSNGGYYGEQDVWDRLDGGVWAICCWDTRYGREWVEADDGSLLCLTPVPAEDLPAAVVDDLVDGRLHGNELRSPEGGPSR